MPTTSSPFPSTDSKPLNVAMGASVAGVTNTALTVATAPINGPVPAVVATAIFLNLIIQPVKKLKWFPEHEGSIFIGIIVGFIVGYFLLYHGDTANSFVNAVCSTFQSLANYKADKLSGLNIMPATPPEMEFGNARVAANP